MKHFARKEDNRLVRGLGRFVDDEGGASALHCRLVRSPYAHAKILSIDTSAAEAMDGVVCTLVGSEVVAQTTKFIQMAPPPAGNVVDYCMATDKVRFQGEPVAAVVARTPAIAADAAELVRVEYEPLPAVTDAIESLKDEVILHESSGTNRTWSSVFDWGEVDDGFRRCRRGGRHRPIEIPPLLFDAAGKLRRARQLGKRAGGWTCCPISFSRVLP